MKKRKKITLSCKKDYKKNLARIKKRFRDSMGKDELAKEYLIALEKELNKKNWCAKELVRSMNLQSEVLFTSKKQKWEV